MHDCYPIFCDISMKEVTLLPQFMLLVEGI